MKPDTSIVAMTVRPNDGLKFTPEEQSDLNWEVHTAQRQRKIIKKYNRHNTSDAEALVYTFTTFNLIEAVYYMKKAIELKLNRKCDIYATAHSVTGMYIDISLVQNESLVIDVAPNLSPEEAIERLYSNVIHYEAFKEQLITEE